MTATSARPRLSRSLVGGTVIVAVGLGIGQVAAYALNLVAARVLGRSDFGALAALLTLILIGNVVSLGVQAVTARRLVLLPVASRDGAGLSALFRGCAAGLGVAAATVVVAPLAVHLLHLPGPLSVLMVAVSLVPLTIMGAVQGVAQGREHPWSLAGAYVVINVGRSVGAIVAAVTVGGVTATMVGLAIGSFVGLGLGLLIVRHLVGRPRLALPGFVPELGHASHALLALFVLTGIDLLLARHFLPAADSGLYAVGNVITKVAFWLPQAIVVIAFPRLADKRRGRTLLLGAGASLAVGLAFTLACAVVPGLVVRIVGGSGYEELSSLVWVFALAGAMQSLAQYLLYSRLAVADRTAVYVLWVAVALLVVAVVVGEHATPAQIVTTMLVVVTLLDVALGVLSARRTAPAQDPAGQAGGTNVGS